MRFMTSLTPPTNLRACLSPLNSYTASLFAVTVPVSTNGHKPYHLLDGMHKLILSTYHGDKGYEICRNDYLETY